MLTANNAGFTTPEKASQTVKAIRQTLAANLFMAAEKFARFARDIEDGTWRKEPTYGQKDVDLQEGLPNLPTLTKTLAASEYAAQSTNIEKISLEQVGFAKSYLGHHYEHTIVIGMRVEWQAVRNGQTLKHEGTVLGMDGDEVAVGDVIVWERGCGSSSKGIHVVKNGSLKAQEPDLY